MTDWNNPHVWNAIVSLLGGTSIALAERLIVKHTGPWLYTSTQSGHAPIKEEVRLYSQARQCVDILEEAERGRNIADNGERIDVRALRQRDIAKRFGRHLDEEIYVRREHHQLPVIEHIVCYSNTDTLKRGSVEAKIIASPLVYTLQKRRKKVEAYAIGTDLIKIEDARHSGIISLQRQSGFNLYKSLIDLYSSKFQNPTYIFFLMESSPVITDPENEARAYQAINNNNVVPVFIEFGKPRPPFKIRKLATYLDATYIQLPDNYNVATQAIPDVFKQAVRKMRDVVN